MNTIIIQSCFTNIIDFAYIQVHFDTYTESIKETTSTKRVESKFMVGHAAPLLTFAVVPPDFILPTSSSVVVVVSTLESLLARSLGARLGHGVFSSMGSSLQRSVLHTRSCISSKTVPKLKAPSMSWSACSSFD